MLPCCPPCLPQPTLSPPQHGRAAHRPRAARCCLLCAEEEEEEELSPAEQRARRKQRAADRRERARLEEAARAPALQAMRMVGELQSVLEKRAQQQ